MRVCPVSFLSFVHIFSPSTDGILQSTYISLCPWSLVDTRVTPKAPDHCSRVVKMRAPRARPWRACTPPLRCVRRPHDVVAISNLCVDVLVRVDELPDANPDTLARLTSDPPSTSQWEVGGNANFLIASARIGMHSCAVGCVGSDAHGCFLKDVLHEEGVRFQHVAVDVSTMESIDDVGFHQPTLVCFVLVDGRGNHRFCSAYDFGPWPLLGGRRDVPRRVRQALADTRAVYLNGFAFDELEASLVDEIMQEARRDGADLFFDIGPRAFGLEKRPAVWKENLQHAMGQADVLLLTLEEAEAFTLEREPTKAAEFLLKGEHTKWVVLKDGPNGATLYTADGQMLHQDAFHIDVVDTVGCGDSFASAIVMGYTGKHDIAATLKLANAVGAATATKQGAGRNVASFEMVRRLLYQSMDKEDEYQREVAHKALAILDKRQSAGHHPAVGA